MRGGVSISVAADFFAAGFFAACLRAAFARGAFVSAKTSNVVMALPFPRLAPKIVAVPCGVPKCRHGMAGIVSVAVDRLVNLFLGEAKNEQFQAGWFRRAIWLAN